MTASRVQLFGRRDSRDTQKALRFFKERRVEIHFVDLAVRPLASAELRRLASRLGARPLLDASSRAFRDQGLGYLRMDEAEVLERLGEHPELLVLPLIRFGELVTAGVDEATWRRWLAPSSPSA